MIWSKEEEKILTELCNKGCMIEQAEKVFPDRTRHSIQAKVSNLGLSLAGVKPVIDYEAFKKIMGGTINV